jgi:predicted nucleotidyltransferase
MRISGKQVEVIRKLSQEVAGRGARVRLFGSRLDDDARGGDVDLMIELDTPVENPALLAAQLAARVSRAMHGRRVDVVISAPNLQRLPIHEVAAREGILL